MDLDAITIETDRFEHRTARPDAINPGAFGADFAAWLRGELRGLEAEGYALSEPIAEDYGWGFWVTRGKDPVWIAIGLVGDGPSAVSGAAEWVVSVTYDPGLNLLRRLFHRPDEAAIARLRNRVRAALAGQADIRIVQEPPGE